MAAQIDTKKDGGYRAAVDLLARIRTLATKAGKAQRFTELLAAVTAEHARKRNVTALVDNCMIVVSFRPARCAAGGRHR